ncbi:MAG: pyridoxal-dependent decarboxylase [Phaeodactylibacter sp.]|uniref:pyridoxal phosphate-dependent decarboxylase family protein n=1 Tax=Phaeodactylibacter sp. TaxID=1940289 RepID=UPI0032EBAE1C
MQTNDILQSAFDPEQFRETGHQLIDLLADHLQAVQGRQNGAIPYLPPAEQAAFWKEDLRSPAGSPIGFFQEVLSRSVQVQHPRYMGHQVCPPAPLAALGSLVDGLLNNGMAVYEMGMAASTIEQEVVKAVARKMGFSEQAGGVLTSGGTLANLTALLAARAIKNQSAAWTVGQQGARFALMVSEEAHYCVDRAVRIMGWGEGGILKIPVDAQFRMRHELLPAYLAKARAEGLEVIAVVGSACSTSTGSFDNLNALADFCAAENLWLHVDGAHGAALALSPQHRQVVSGLERADSVAMDFHKMLLTPVLATALIFREESDSYKTFSQRAQYLWEGQTEQEWYNLAKRTFECTKLMMGVKVYALFRTYGFELWEAYLDRVMENGAHFATLVRAHPDFELAVEPGCNIVCFRYKSPGASLTQLNRLNSAIRQFLLEDGRFYIVQTQLKGHSYLRVTLTNPHTSQEDIEALLTLIASKAPELQEQ